MTTICTPEKELILPPGVKPLDQPEPDAPAEEKIGMLPEPVGFKLLCGVPKAADVFESGIAKAKETIANEESGTTVLFVMALGPDAYKDEKRFPTGPWCKKGDFVLVRTYSGTRFKIFGREFRVIADDMVEAVVADPRGVVRFNA